MHPYAMVKILCAGVLEKYFSTDHHLVLSF